MRKIGSKFLSPARYRAPRMNTDRGLQTYIVESRELLTAMDARCLESSAPRSGGIGQFDPSRRPYHQGARSTAPRSGTPPSERRRIA
jgi:hypothetical protein